MTDRERENGQGRDAPDTPGGEARPGERDGPGPGAPGDLPPEGEIRCKLERADGSEWTVTDLLLTPEGLFINAYRYVRERGIDAESRREVLDHEPSRPACPSRAGDRR